jgi:hydrogenase/urease accessory protein HupE
MIAGIAARLTAIALLTPVSAFAHSPIEGIDNFYNGILHPLFVPSHLLLLVATGLLFGQRGPRKHQAALAGFLLATIAGLAANWFLTLEEYEAVVLIGAALVGLVVAIKPPLNAGLILFIALSAGLALGLDSSPGALVGKEKFVFLFGCVIGIYLLMLYPMGIADRFNSRAWQIIGVRVIGSWVAASAVLVLALSFASP